MLDGTFFFTVLPPFVAVAAGLLLLFIVVKCVLSMRRWKSSLDTPPSTCPATVLRKETKEKNRRAMGLSSFEAEKTTLYFITFLLEDDSKKTVSVEESVYHLVAEGDRGTLWLRGDTMLKFERF